MSAKPHTALDEMEDGAFARTAAGYRSTDVVSEPDRYHLYVALACPWAHGALAALRYKGLEGAIGWSNAHPTWRRTRPDDPEDQHCGWWFRAPGDPPVSNELGFGSFECDEACIPDTVNGCRTIRELYELAKDTAGKYTTPVLWDKKEKRIVSNESLDLLKIFDGGFQSLAKHPERLLYPKDPAKQAKCDALQEWIYPTINNGVYRCGFAQSQEHYETALRELFASLDRLEAHFATGTSFLTGKDFTWIDLRLYMTLVRFDPVYVTYFKTNLKRLEDYPHLLNFTRRCYAIKALRADTNLRHIKVHYFTSHPTINRYAVIPGYDGACLWPQRRLRLSPRWQRRPSPRARRPRRR